jgi:NDP-sugar pyrophosphorylase family protein
VGLPAVVLAGGLGTRVEGLTGGTIPKAMVAIAGRPFIDYKLLNLRAGGVREVIVLAGHLGNQLETHVDQSDSFGMSVRVLHEGPQLLGTAGALRNAIESLPEAFFLTYGDSLLLAPMQPVAAAFEQGAEDALMTVFRNEDRGGPSNVEVHDGRVTAYHKHPPEGCCTYIDYGLLVMRRDILRWVEPGAAADLAVVFDALIRSGSLAAFEVDAPFFEVGTRDRYRATAEYIVEHALWDEWTGTRA